jgi:hypothetical protein
MTEEQFDELRSATEGTETNTSWTWYVFNEVESINKTMVEVKDALEENNDLLKELIEVIKGKR